jgi:micrococcal nuclease
MNVLRIPALVVVCLLAVAANTAITGKVVGVADGDTLTILTADKEQIKIRLEGIDAPEGGQDFGTKAKQALSDKVFGKQVTCNKTGEDRYGRTLANVYVGERWINQELVADGAAWHFTKYSADKQLAAAEKQAREAKRGLWALPKQVAPWDYRKPATGEVTTVYITKTGTKYHRENCRHLSGSKIAISIEDARAKYEACKTCKPN